MRFQTKHLHHFLTYRNSTNPKHLKIYQPFLNYRKNIWSHSVHPNNYKKYFYFFFIQYEKRKILCLSTKERNEKFKTNDLIFRKKINLPSGTLLSAKCNSTESLTNKSKQTVNFSNIPKIPFSLAPSKKYIIIEEFKDKQSLKNILNGIKNLKLLR